MIRYSIVQETEAGCILQESYLNQRDAEHELTTWRNLDPAGVYAIEESEYEESAEDRSTYADAPLFYGRYCGENCGTLIHGAKVAVYSLEGFEREHVDAAIDFKILLHESGDDLFFYVCANEIDVLADNVLAA